MKFIILYYIIGITSRTIKVFSIVSFIHYYGILLYTGGNGQKELKDASWECQQQEESDRERSACPFIFLLLGTAAGIVVIVQYLLQRDTQRRERGDLCSSTPPDMENLLNAEIEMYVRYANETA